MPNGDGTGPRGMGQLTGKGLGPCGCKIRRGLGRRCLSKPINLTKDEEKKILQENLKDIEAEKEAIQKRLEEL